VKASLIAGTNNKTIQSPLMVGQEICLPPSATVPAPINLNVVTTTTVAKIVCVGKYTVKTGDSWSGIAAKVGVKISELTSANGKTSRSTLLPGQELCLPRGAVTAPATAPSNQAPPTTQPPRYVPTKTFTRAELEKFVRDAWPDNLEENAFYVVHRESRWNPLARNSCCIGLFQLNWNAHKSWMKKNHGITDAAELLNPEINAKLAYATWQRSGSWRPWCTTNWCPTP
jgi:LysM repeat protein